MNGNSDANSNVIPVDETHDNLDDGVLLLTLSAEELCHLLLGKPDVFVIEADFEGSSAVRALVDDDVFWQRCSWGVSSLFVALFMFRFNPSSSG